MTSKSAVEEISSSSGTNPGPSERGGQDLEIKIISDLPPEVNLAEFMMEKLLETLDETGNSLIQYRLVNLLWKTTIDTILERKCLKREFDGVQTITIVSKVEDQHEPLFGVRPEILTHSGNPFPAKSLRVLSKALDNRKQFQHAGLYGFLSRFGANLSSLMLENLSLGSADKVVEILSHVPNLKLLRVDQIGQLVSRRREILHSLPVLPSLSTLDLFASTTRNRDENSTGNINFWEWFLDAYGNQLECLILRCKIPFLRQTQKLKHLEIFYPSHAFFQRSVAPPLQRLSVTGFSEVDTNLNINVLMRFVDQFCNTLEQLSLDFKWKGLFNSRRRIDLEQIFPGIFNSPVDNCRNEVIAAGGVLATAAVIHTNLVKFTITFPTEEVAADVISKTFLTKFPRLKSLQLLRFNPWNLVSRNGVFKIIKIVDDQDELEQDLFHRFVQRQTGSVDRTHPEVDEHEIYESSWRKLDGFLNQSRYWEKCGQLQRISVSTNLEESGVRQVFSFGRSLE